jgi:hypothetical protein
MAYTVTDLERLDRMIAKGVTKARYGDKELSFASMRELMQVRDRIQSELDQQAGKSGRFQMHHPAPRKGL